MITLFSGTPGSGKSYCVLPRILRHLRRGGWVITNIALDFSSLKDGEGLAKRYIYVTWKTLTVELLDRFARLYHVARRESQTLLVLDEALLRFNSRDSLASDRRPWLDWFSKHRHMGYDVILIAQIDRMLDRQIRGCIEYEVKHRRLQRVLWWLPGLWFVQVSCWYGVRAVVDRSVVRYNKRLAQLYDTFADFRTVTAADLELPEEGRKTFDRSRRRPGRLRQLVLSIANIYRYPHAIMDVE